MPKEKVTTPVVAKKVSAVPPKASGEVKKKRKPSFDKYDTHLRAVLHDLRPEIGTTKETTSVMDSLMKDVFGRMMKQAMALCTKSKRHTLGAKEILASADLCLPSKIAAGSRQRAQEAIDAYKKYNSE